MTRRFDFDSNNVVFNDHPFKGDGHLIGLPRSPEDMFGGRVMVASRPHELSYFWLSEIQEHGGITINGTIEEPNGSIIKLQNGTLTQYSVMPDPSSGMLHYTFEFEVIDPPL